MSALDSIETIYVFTWHSTCVSHIRAWFVRESPLRRSDTGCCKACDTVCKKCPRLLSLRAGITVMGQDAYMTGFADDEEGVQVAALLELYSRSLPNPDLLLTALPTLLGALRRALHAGPPQQPLAERLVGLITKLSK